MKNQKIVNLLPELNLNIEDEATVSLFDMKSMCATHYYRIVSKITESEHYKLDENELKTFALACIKIGKQIRSDEIKRLLNIHE